MECEFEFDTVRYSLYYILSIFHNMALVDPLRDQKLYVSMTALGGHLVLWTVVLIFIEYRGRIVNPLKSPVALTVENEDIDVAAERRRMLTESSENDVIRLIGLRKEYLLIMTTYVFHFV